MGLDFKTEERSVPSIKRRRTPQKLLRFSKSKISYRLVVLLHLSLSLASQECGVMIFSELLRIVSMSLREEMRFWFSIFDKIVTARFFSNSSEVFVIRSFQDSWKIA